jgi:PAS domain S-box-containing protein
MPLRHRSLAAVVAATLVAVTTVLLGTYSILSYRSDAKRQRDALLALMHVQSDELSVALALPVWNIDRAQIRRVIGAMARPKSVYGISVIAADGTYGLVRDANWDLVPWNGKSVPPGMFVEERPILFADNEIGTVRLVVTPKYFQNELRDTLIHIAGTIVAVDILLVLGTYFVLWRAVVRPLTEIEKYAVAVSTGVKQADVPLVAPGFTAELESLRGCIEMMVGQLEKRYGQLKESGERFRSIFDAVNDAIVINDVASGDILDANAAMCAMFGYTIEELRSIGIGPLSAGDLSFTEADALMRIRKAAAGERQLFEWHSRHKDGHLFWTEVNLHVAVIGDYRRSIVVVRDITQRKQMEEALKEEKDFTDTAIKAMTGIFFVQDRQWRFVRWNDALEDLAARAGRTVEESGGGVLVHPDDRDLVAEKIEEVFDRGFAHVEVRIVLDDDIRYFFLNARRMEVDGEPFLVGTGFDVTERRRAEAEQKRLQHEVERSAAEWKETFDTVTTPILIMERNGAVVRVNRAALELSGLSEAAISGLKIAEIGDGEPWQTASQLVSYVAGDRQGTTAETKDAGGRTWDIIITRFSAADGGADRFIIVLWEITGIVELQESLRRNETLSAMGTLVAGVAHEVRNPLFGISATLDAFQEEMSQPGYAECGATLRQEVNRLVHLMQELLEYGKPAALSIERGDVSEVVGEAVESRRSSADAAQVEIRNAMAVDMPALLMDPSRLRQVFENLIDNAIQHSDPGMTVHIDCNVVDHAGRQWVECSVEDEGPGFAPQDFDRVFEPFFSQREGGTGLGLSIVQRIVEEHSGRVVAANRPEGGGSIRVLLPLPEHAQAARSGAQ